MTNAVVEKLQAKFPSGVTGHSEFRGDVTVELTPDQLHDAALFLRDDEALQFNLLVDVYGTDRLKLGQTPRFAVNYELYSVPQNRFLRIIVPAPAPSSSNGKEALPSLPSVTDVWPTANWLERETYDLMGIEFSHHPWLRRMMPSASVWG